MEAKKSPVKKNVSTNVETLDIDFDKFIENFNEFAKKKYRLTNKVKSSLISYTNRKYCALLRLKQTISLKLSIVIYLI